MPENCRVGVCGFDPMIVKGYVKTGERALWWHISDELYEKYNVKPGTVISGTLLAVYNSDGNKVHTPNEAFAWKTSKESGLAVLLPPETIVKYQLTEFHFLELQIDKVGDVPVYPGEQKISSKFWPQEKMKLDFKLAYIG
ncbi:MAG: hypothetical protein ACE14L_00930 [Terriglobales bacterium]